MYHWENGELITAEKLNSTGFGLRVEATETEDQHFIYTTFDHTANWKDEKLG